MDGFQSDLKRSLQFKLSLWLSLIILAAAAISGGLAFKAVYDDFNELQDDDLREVAALIDRHQLMVTATAPRSHHPESDPDSHIVIALIPPSTAQPRPLPPQFADLPLDLPEGLQTIMLRQLRWRLLIKNLDSGERLAIGQQTIERDEIARHAAGRTLVAFVILIPLVLLVLNLVIRRLFRPLSKVASDLEGRAESNLSPVTESEMPSEVRPFVVAINRLLARVDLSATAQRRFIAGASHELRSPLTALSLQAERLEAADMSPEGRVRLTSLRIGIERMRNLLNQLLTLARAQDGPRESAVTSSLHEALRNVLEEVMPQADAKRIDLGVTHPIGGEGDVAVVATRLDLQLLIRNLVGNAIAYTPTGGRIDLSITQGPTSALLRVNDTGPGIPEEQRQRVFDSFYRIQGSEGTGSGLGLSIVQTIANKIGATVSFSHTHPASKTGLSVQIAFRLPQMT